MKKVYLLISTLLIGTLGVAQNSSTQTEPIKERKVADIEQHHHAPTQTSATRGGGVIYSQDFAGGMPADWSAETISGPCTWQWTDVGHTGDFPSQSLESTTAANGWMILDSDLCGAEGGDSEDAYLNGPSIDCSAYSAVSVSFEQYIRKFPPAAEVTTLEVSVDGGSVWTEYEFNIGLGQEGTDNPDYIQQNISDIAAGQSDVRFRFRWQGTWGYGWQIDDFAVFVPEEYDLTLSATDYQEEWIFDDEDNLRDLAYSVYPVSEVRDMTFRGTITNNGAVEQTDVAFQVHVVGPSYDQTFTSDPATIAPAEVVDFTIPGITPDANIGMFDITYSAISGAEDINPADNERTSWFEVSEAMYAFDRGVAEGEFTNFDDDYKLGTTFYMEVDEDLHCAGVALGTSSVTGTSYNIELLDRAELGYIAESQLATVPDVDGLNDPGESKWQWTFMDGVIPMLAGSEYTLVLNHFGGADDVVLRLSGTSPAQVSFIYEGVEATWYYVTSTPMIRMGLSEEYCLSVGLEEAVDQITVNELYPNPTVGATTLEYSLLENAEVELYLFDQLGRVVMNEAKGMQPVGTYKYDYNFENLASGMYTFSILVNDKVVTKKLTIR